MEDQETESFFDNYNLRNLRQQTCYESQQIWFALT